MLNPYPPARPAYVNWPNIATDIAEKNPDVLNKLRSAYLAALEDVTKDGFDLPTHIGYDDWPLVVGGKPFASVPAYTVIAFELTILFGGLATFLGLLIVGGLYPRRLDKAYSARFSAEEFGVAVRCKDRDVAEIDSLMRSHTAKEVSVVEA